MKEELSPMADSTFFDEDERTLEELGDLYSRRFRALNDAMFSAERFELLIEGMSEFLTAAQQLTQVKGLDAENHEDNPLIVMSEIVDGAARSVLYSIVDLYGRQCAFNAVAALRDLDEEIQRPGGKKRRKR